MHGNDEDFQGTCWLFDDTAGVHTGNGVTTSVCYIKVKETVTAAVAQTGTDPNGLGMWQPTDTESWYSGNGNEGYVEADCGTTDTRYEGTWDAEHTIWPGEWTVPAAAITADGDLGDWDGIAYIAQVPFYPYNAHPLGNGGGSNPGGGMREFDEHNGGVWFGIQDQASASAFAWDANNIYHAVKVIDDSHQTNGETGWDGDTVQVILATTERSSNDRLAQVTNFNNYGLSNVGGTTSHTIHGEDTSVMVMTRDNAAKTTIYELKYPASNFGVDSFSSGDQFGVGVCVNDGDADNVGGAATGQGGQKGWSGWGPYAIVHGHKSQPCGLITLG
jgi:hypothetical protein